MGARLFGVGERLFGVGERLFGVELLLFLSFNIFRARFTAIFLSIADGLRITVEDDGVLLVVEEFSSAACILLLLLLLLAVTISVSTLMKSVDYSVFAHGIYRHTSFLLHNSHRMLNRKCLIIQ